MRKFILSIVFMAMVSFSFGQNANFGIRLGGVTNTIRGSDIDLKAAGLKSKFGPTAGFYINSMPSEYLWIKTEFNYVSRTLGYTDQGKSLNVTDHYVDIYPLTPAIHISGLQLFVGPAIGIYTVTISQFLDADGNIRTETEAEPGRNVFEFGYMMGVEYEFPFGLNIGVRHVRGISSLYEPENKVRVEMFNRATMFTLGYTIGKD